MASEQPYRPPPDGPASSPGTNRAEWTVISGDVMFACDGADTLWSNLPSLPPLERTLVVFDLGNPERTAMTHVAGQDDADALLQRFGTGRVIACLASAGWLNGMGFDIDAAAAYHLPCELRSIALVISQAECGDQARRVYWVAKCFELLCETIRLRRAGKLLSIVADSELSLADSVSLLAARRMITERFHEKLTLDSIARACGLNRAKLTRGFREMFGCSIAEALAEQRLQQASRLLRSTDKPVSSIGYDTGYLNNASFARAFSRRFGMSPSAWRAEPLAVAAMVADSAACDRIAA